MTTTATPRRVRYEVLPTTKAERAAGAEAWKFTRDGETIATRASKADAVELASTTARCAWRTTGQLGTLKIKGRLGKIQDERTYGRDPIRTKG